MIDVNASLPRILPVVLGYSHFASTTALCLDTLLPQVQELGQKVLAVDNGSPDNSATLLQQYANASTFAEHLTVRLHDENLGFGGGMNAAIAYGLEVAQADWVMLINSDTLFPPNALRAWLGALSVATSDIGLVGPLTNNAGNAQRLAIETRSGAAGLDTTVDFVSWSQAVADMMKQPTGLLWRVQRVDFFCVAIRTQVWLELGGLDLAYGRGYYEDFDFSIRAAHAGFQSRVTEDCFIFHQGSAVFKTNPEQKQLIRNNKKLILSRFPKLELPHTRVDNLALIQQQLNWLHSQPIQSTNLNVLVALRLRLQLRWAQAQRDLPRSPLKRWLWRRRLSAVQSFFKTKP